MPSDHSFAPVWRADARILILGSLPGKRSIAVQGYYAHPRNAFWPIMADLLKFDLETPYPERLDILREHRIALWDVVEQAQRVGSLDSAIQRQGLRYNPIPQLIDQCADLKLVAFNGGAAADMFNRAAKTWSQEYSALQQVRLPSTSPAYAALNLQQKKDTWRELIASYIGGTT